MSRCYWMAGLVIGLGLVAFQGLAAPDAKAEQGGFFDGRWRLSAGAVYSSPIKTKLGFRPASLRPASLVPVRQGLSAAEAEAKVMAGTLDQTSGRTIYGNGAWSAPDDGVDGDDFTWNAYFPAGAYREDSRCFSLGEVEYGQSVDSYTPEGLPEYGDSDHAALPGVNLELARELYRNEEDRYGVDLAFGATYFFKNKVFKADCGYLAGKEHITPGGAYEGLIAAPDELPNPDDWYWNDDGSYGRGGLDTDFNGGPVFNLGSIHAVRHPGGDAYDRETFGAMRLRGDYRQLDLGLTLRPYWEVKEWLRLYGTIGAVASYSKFKLSVTMADNDLEYHRRARFSQWRVQGVGGLGMMLRHKDWTLAGDFLARFLDDDLDIRDRDVRGSVREGHWMFRLTLGYEF